jgi:bifunctional DNase/RNase
LWINARSAVINDFKAKAFCATLILRKDGNPYEVNCFPSDAIGLAFKQLVPIYAAESVMVKQGIGLKEFLDTCG